MGATTVANKRAKEAAVTAMKAAKAKGFNPSFAMLLNLTLEPTPAKAIARRNGITVPERKTLKDGQVNPRMLIPEA